MKSPVIAIGLDSADPELVERWMGEGRLPVLERLRAEGAYGRLEGVGRYKAEIPWTMFLTGCRPEKTFHWGPIKYAPETCLPSEPGAYDFRAYPPFYALGDEFRVAMFDMPQSRPHDDVDGLQVVAWGAHSPQAPSESRPASLLEEIHARHGNHPTLLNDHKNCYDREALARLRDDLETGITRRTAICRDLLRREPWDLFLTAYGETHVAEHSLWHLSLPHPVSERLDLSGLGDAVPGLFQRIDSGIGEILAEAPDDAYFVVFSVHGMTANVADVASMLLLPEFMHRWNFPGKSLLPGGDINGPPPPPDTRYPRHWKYELWDMMNEPEAAGLASPAALNAEADPLDWMPARWYAAVWPQMRAFALPSYSEGYIRFNVRGREGNGIVEPADYESVCEDLVSCLGELVDARTGKRMVRKIERVRRTPDELDPALPDADLIVHWDDERPVDVVDSPRVGRIGPVPFFRTGGHRSPGFALVRGPGIAAGQTLPPRPTVDLPPTILSLMGAPVAGHLDGTPIQFARRDSAAS